MNRRTMSNATLGGSIIAAALTGCADRGLNDQRARETTPPVLQVTEPSRAFVADGFTSVMVRGRASDTGSGLASVTINGLAAEVAGDGTFELQLGTPEGITLLHTVATDVDGNVTRDTRSVLAGAFAAAQDPVEDAMAVRVNGDTLSAIGLIGADTVNGMDMGAIAQPYNPIMEKGFTCLNVDVSVDAIDKSDVELTLDPVDGGLAFSFTLHDLFVDMTADFSAVCIPGSAGLSLSASTFRLDGTMALGIDGAGDVAAAVAGAQASFTDFNLDVGIIPGDVVELIVSDIDQRVANAIATQLEGMVPGLIEGTFGEFGVERSVSLLGHQLDLGFKPVVVDFDTSGGTIVLDSRIAIQGQENGIGWLRTPNAIPSMPNAEGPGDGFKLAVADDVFNQALNAFWAAGVMEKSFAVGDGSGQGLGALVDGVDVWLPIPPVVSADPVNGAVTVTVGDLQVDVLRDDGNGGMQVVSRLSLNASIAIGVEVTPADTLRLRTGSVTTYLDIVEEGVVGPNPLNDADVEALGSFVAAQVTTMVGTIVGELPVPAFPSARVTNLSLGPAQGYAVMGGNVEPL